MTWWKKPTIQAGALVALGLLLTAWVAYLGSGKNGIDPLSALLLALLAGVFQVAGASKFHSSGRADPTLARASVRRLIALGVRARDATKLAETAFESGSPAEAKRLMGKLSSELSFIQENAMQSIEDWREFHADALEELDKER